MKGASGRDVLWWLLVATIVTAVIVAVVLKQGYGESDLIFLAWLAYAPVGAVVARRRPTNPIGWIFLSVGLVASIGAVCLQIVDTAVEKGPPVSNLAILADLYANLMIFPLVLLAATFTFLLYPSGLLSPRWRPILWLGWSLFVLYLCFPLMIPTVGLVGTHPDALEIEVENPIHVATAPESLYNVALVLMVVLNLAAISSALIRAWRSLGVERLQMRLFAASVVVLLASLWPAQYLATNGHSLARYVLLAGAFALIPLSCGVAILRYHLYDIDRVIGRTTAYALVSGVLLSVYAAVVMTISRVLPESSDLGVALATLSAAALFRPVLSWARRLVARRFNRDAFDADQVVERFAYSLRDELDPGEVQTQLIAALRQTVQPGRAGLWLRERAP